MTTNLSSFNALSNPRLLPLSIYCYSSIDGFLNNVDYRNRLRLVCPAGCLLLLLPPACRATNADVLLYPPPSTHRWHSSAPPPSPPSAHNSPHSTIATLSSLSVR